jgi:hypothetical protein
MKRAVCPALVSATLKSAPLPLGRMRSGMRRTFDPETFQLLDISSAVSATRRLVSLGRLSAISGLVVPLALQAALQSTSWNCILNFNFLCHVCFSQCVWAVESAVNAFLCGLLAERHKLSGCAMSNHLGHSRVRYLRGPHVSKIKLL